MEMFKRWMVGGVAGLVLLVCVGVATAGKDQPVPFKGSSENQAISAMPVDAEHVFVTTVGEGTATHLGKFTFISPHLSGLVDFSIDGTQTFTAANGDELHATLSGALSPVPVEGRAAAGG